MLKRLAFALAYPFFWLGILPLAVAALGWWVATGRMWDDTMEWYCFDVDKKFKRWAGIDA